MSQIFFLIFLCIVIVVLLPPSIVLPLFPPPCACFSPRSDQWVVQGAGCGSRHYQLHGTLLGYFFFESVYLVIQVSDSNDQP
jgi:hypothetical protein